eukprot:6178111-Pleurochrysis_carterae.AAC.1
MTAGVHSMPLQGDGRWSQLPLIQSVRITVLVISMITSKRYNRGSVASSTSQFIPLSFRAHSHAHNHTAYAYALLPS